MPSLGLIALIIILIVGQVNAFSADFYKEALSLFESGMSIDPSKITTIQTQERRCVADWRRGEISTETVCLIPVAEPILKNGGISVTGRGKKQKCKEVEPNLGKILTKDEDGELTWSTEKALHRLREIHRFAKVKVADNKDDEKYWVMVHEDSTYVSGSGWLKSSTVCYARTPMIFE